MNNPSEFFCVVCEQWLSEGSFHASYIAVYLRPPLRKGSGRNLKCKACLALQRKKRYEDHPEWLDATLKKYKNGPKGAAATLRSTLRNANKLRAWKQFTDAYKLERQCAECNDISTNADAFEFDHLPEFEKSFNICNGWGFTKDKQDAEIAKCEVVHVHCHRKRTRERRQYGGWANGGRPQKESVT